MGAEIGVHKGDFAQRILEVVQPARLHLVDPWRYEDEPVYRRAHYGGEKGHSQANMDARYEAVCARFRRAVAAGNVVIHRLESLTASTLFADGSLDWVYVDANHLYENVRQDLIAWWPKIRTGGLLTGDDYGLTGWWDNGVTRAVDEFVANHDVSWQLLPDRQYLLRH